MSQLQRCIEHPEFQVGAREMAAVCLGISAWGLVTGVAMVEGGLSVPLAILISLTVFAGSAQLATLPLLVSSAPLWVIFATAFCVNVRFVIFSAQWRPYVIHLPFWRRLGLGYLAGDMQYFMFMKRFGDRPGPVDGAVHYMLGSSSVNYVAWQVPSILGILMAQHIPVHWGLGFAGVLALLGLMLSMLQDKVMVVAAVVAGGAAVAAFALPFKLNILVAIASAVVAGWVMESGGWRRPVHNGDPSTKDSSGRSEP